ncbi:MAG: dephospho-CoA kinase [Thiobacillus sp.]|nr:dephospho-CoA kinase [Thiobacillus sp.]
MFTVGLTGGIGSGKSTVADCFAALGVPVIDTDVIARDLTAPARGTPPDAAEGSLPSSGEPAGVPLAGARPAGGAALEEIRAVFGETVMQADGTLDRAALRRRVFADSAARRQLEAILHPRIRQVVGDRLATLSAPYALVVIPLLVETGGYRDMLNRVLVVDCPEDVQIARVKARSGLAHEEIKAILAAQAGRAERLAVADDIIVNTATPEALHAEVVALHQRYLALAAVPPP